MPDGPGLQLVLASANLDKAAEIAAILGWVPGVKVLARPAGLADVEETGQTLLENARLKAVAVMKATGMAAVSDDTGLEVEALGGAPGVYSARFSGEHATYAENVAKLISELERVGATRADRRSATFRTVALVAYPNGDEVWAEGSVAGLIAPVSVGNNGFGYDPIFAPHGFGGRTFAQMTVDEKHGISHRGGAFRSLGQLLAGPRASS